jgi:hypothetical protein
MAFSVTAGSVVEAAPNTRVSRRTVTISTGVEAVAVACHRRLPTGDSYVAVVHRGSPLSGSWTNSTRMSRDSWLAMMVSSCGRYFSQSSFCARKERSSSSWSPGSPSYTGTVVGDGAV